MCINFQMQTPRSALTPALSHPMGEGEGANPFATLARTNVSDAVWLFDEKQDASAVPVTSERPCVVHRCSLSHRMGEG